MCQTKELLFNFRCDAQPALNEVKCSSFCSLLSNCVAVCPDTEQSEVEGSHPCTYNRSIKRAKIVSLATNSLLNNLILILIYLSTLLLTDIFLSSSKIARGKLVACRREFFLLCFLPLR